MWQTLGMAPLQEDNASPSSTTVLTNLAQASGAPTKALFHIASLLL